MTHVNTAHRGVRIAAALVAVILGATACGQRQRQFVVGDRAALQSRQIAPSVNGDASQVAPAAPHPAAEHRSAGDVPVGIRRHRCARRRDSAEQEPGDRRQLRHRGRRHQQGDQRCRRAVRPSRRTDLRAHDQHHRRSVVDGVVRDQVAARAGRVGHRRSRRGRHPAHRFAGHRGRHQSGRRHRRPVWSPRRPASTGCASCSRRQPTSVRS